jgi:hypothetical protein
MRKEKMEIKMKIPEDAKEFILENVIFSVENRRKWKDILRDAPHIPFLDIEIMYRIARPDDEDGISQPLIRTLPENITAKELYKAAKQNMNRTKFTVRNLDDFLEEMTGMRLGRIDAYIATNEKEMYGATALLRKDLLKELSQRLRSDLYIVPSSVHEILILKADENNPDSDCLRRTLHGMNGTKAVGDSKLSDNVYRYSREDGLLYYA